MTGLKVNVTDCNDTLNKPLIHKTMGLRGKQSTQSNVFLPVAKLTQQPGYIWSAYQHTHLNEDAGKNDRLHFHILIGVPNKGATALHQAAVYKSMSDKIAPLEFRTETTNNPSLLAIYNLWGTKCKHDDDRLFLGCNHAQILKLLANCKRNIVDNDATVLESDITDGDVTSGQQVVVEEDAFLQDMLGDIAEQLKTNDIAVDGMVDSEPEEDDMFGGVVRTENNRPVGEPAAKKGKLQPIDIFKAKVNYCLKWNLFCVDDYNAHVSWLLGQDSPIPFAISSMITNDRYNKSVLDRASQMAYDRGCGAFISYVPPIGSGLVEALSNLTSHQYNCMYAWALVVCGKTPEKESNVYIWGEPNAGKSYIFARPMPEIFHMVNSNLNQDKAFYATEMAAFALMSVFDDVTINIKDMTCLEILKNILAKNSIELNTKYSSKEKSKARPMLFLNNCEFFDIIGELGDTHVHLEALKARFFYRARIERFAPMDCYIRENLWRYIFSMAQQSELIDKAEFQRVLTDDPHLYRNEALMALPCLQQSQTMSLFSEDGAISPDFQLSQ